MVVCRATLPEFEIMEEPTTHPLRAEPREWQLDVAELPSVEVFLGNGHIRIEQIKYIGRNPIVWKKSRRA